MNKRTGKRQRIKGKEKKRERGGGGREGAVGGLLILLLRSFSPNWQHQALILKGLLWWMGSSNTRSKYALLKILHCRLSQITVYHSSAFVGCSGVQATLKLRICYATSASPS